MKNQEKPFYTITQKQSKHLIPFLKWFKYFVICVHHFDKLGEAVKFALDEQIKIITCNISKKVKTTRRPFNSLLTIEEFKQLAKENPVHYLGVSDSRRLNIELYYFYLVGSNKLHKLQRHIKINQ